MAVESRMDGSGGSVKFFFHCLEPHAQGANYVIFIKFVFLLPNN